MRSRRIYERRYTRKEHREKQSTPQLLLLFVLGIAIVIVLFLHFRSPIKAEESSIQTVASILEVLVAILILVGFDSMMRLQDAVSKWDKDLKEMDMRVDRLELLVSEVDLEKLKSSIETIEIFNPPEIMWFKGRFHELFDNFAQTYRQVVDEYIKKEKVEGTLTDFEKAIRDSFRKSWLFSKTASDLFKPMAEPEKIEEDKNAVLSAIDFLYNQMTCPALKVLRTRKEVSRSLIEYLTNKVKQLEKKKEKEGCKVSEELDMVRSQLNIEFEIYDKLTEVIAEMEEKLKSKCL